MKKQTLVHSSILVAVIITAIISVGLITGFSGAKAFISVDPVSDKDVGESFTITGTTNVPPGSVIVVEISPSSFEPPHDAKYDEDGTISGTFNGMIGTGTIEDGTKKIHLWQFEVDGTRLNQGNYLVKVSAPDADVIGTTGLRIL